jgi:preprotein translocase subunit SecE
LVEHWSPKPGVGSSSLSIRAKYKSKMNFIQYIKDSFEELNNHMTWISKEEAQKTTVTVAVFTILFALAVAGIDYVFQTGLDNFFKLF